MRFCSISRLGNVPITIPTPLLCFRTAPVVSTPCREIDFIPVTIFHTRSQEKYSFWIFVSTVKRYLQSGITILSLSLLLKIVIVVPSTAILEKSVVWKSAMIIQVVFIYARVIDVRVSFIADHTLAVQFQPTIPAWSAVPCIVDGEKTFTVQSVPQSAVAKRVFVVASVPIMEYSNHPIFI